MWVTPHLVVSLLALAPEEHFSSFLSTAPSLSRSWFFYFILLQSTYSVLSISAIQQSDPVIHIYIYMYTFFFSHYPPLCPIKSDWIQFPVLCSRISLLIHSKCNSLHPLAPNSPFFPLPPPPHRGTFRYCFVLYLVVVTGILLLFLFVCCHTHDM